MLESLKLLTARGAMLVCNFAATQYNMISRLDQFQLLDPNVLNMLGSFLLEGCIIWGYWKQGNLFHLYKENIAMEFLGATRL